MQGMDHSKMSPEAMRRMMNTPPAEPSHKHHQTNIDDTSENRRNPHAYAEDHVFNDMIRHSHKDESALGALLVDRLEGLVDSQNALLTYDLQAWWGKIQDKAVIRAEGNWQQGQSTDARNELLWGHALTAYWDSHLGIRYDSGEATQRSWLALGLQGLAPYWLYVEATAYVGEQGRLAARLETEYDLLISQKLILQPRVEFNVYSQNDTGRAIAAGLSDIETGLRLRYEIRREIAPYIGVEWSSAPNNGSNLQRSDALRWLAGVRFWF